MKFSTVIFVLTATALASPVEFTKRGCGTPGTYQCAADKSTIEVCDWNGSWEQLEPGCPTGTVCEDDPYGNNIPYCVVAPGPSTPSGSCTSPGEYSCFANSSSSQGIQICDLSSQTQVVGMCPNFCAYIAGIPYCF